MGWADLEALLNSLRKKRRDWRDLGRADLIEMVESSDKKRFEINGDKIRALYGHSIPQKIKKAPSKPPDAVYH